MHNLSYQYHAQAHVLSTQDIDSCQKYKVNLGDAWLSVRFLSALRSKRSTGKKIKELREL